MTIAGLGVAEVIELALLLLAVGAVAGFMAGIFGIGGGAVLVPVFYECFRLVGVPLEVRMPLCIGTSLAIIIPTSIASFRAHFKRGAVDMAIINSGGSRSCSACWPAASPRALRRSGCSRSCSSASPGRRQRGCCCRATTGNSAMRCRPGPLMRVYGFFIGLLSTLMGGRRRVVRQSPADLLRPAAAPGGRHLLGAGGADFDPRRARLRLCRLAGGVRVSPMSPHCSCRSRSAMSR